MLEWDCHRWVYPVVAESVEPGTEAELAGDGVFSGLLTSGYTEGGRGPGRNDGILMEREGGSENRTKCADVIDGWPLTVKF